MASQVIELRGRAKGVVAALVLIFVAATYVAPSALAHLGLTSGYGWSLLRFGHRETHLVNRAGHWLGTTSKSHRSGPAFALAGERLVIDYAIEPSEGGVSLYVTTLTLPFLLTGERVWTQRTREDGRGQVVVELPETGLYSVRMSFLRFAGSAEIDWAIR